MDRNLNRSFFFFFSYYSTPSLHAQIKSLFFFIFVIFFYSACTPEAASSRAAIHARQIPEPGENSGLAGRVRQDKACCGTVPQAWRSGPSPPGVSAPATAGHRQLGELQLLVVFIIFALEYESRRVVDVWGVGQIQYRNFSTLRFPTVKST